MSDSRDAVRAAYDRVAVDYADLVRVDRAETDLDRALLDDFARRVAGGGQVLDAGCGPGRLTRYLADRGVDAAGVDLSPAMIRTARERHPDLTFRVGTLDDPGVEAGSQVGVLAWYSVIHTAAARRDAVVAGLLAVLRPGGWLLLAAQSGSGTRFLASAYGHRIDLTAHLHTADALAAAVAAGGGDVHVRLTRGPENGERHPQAFVLAHRGFPEPEVRP